MVNCSLHGVLFQEIDPTTGQIVDDGSYIDDRTGTNFARQFFLDPHTTKKQGAKSNELQRTACSKLFIGR